jgi:hypothetical protein
VQHHAAGFRLPQDIGQQDHRYSFVPGANKKPTAGKPWAHDS